MRKSLIIFILLTFSSPIFSKPKHENIKKFSPYFKEGCLLVEIMQTALTRGKEEKDPQLKSFSSEFVSLTKKTGVYSHLKKEFLKQFWCFEKPRVSICSKNLSDPEEIENLYKRFYEFLKVLRGTVEADFFSLGIQACNLRVTLRIKKKNMISESLKGLRIVTDRISKEISWLKNITSKYKTLFLNKEESSNLKEVSKEIDDFISLFL